MASHLVGQNPITTFTTPVNGTSPINADQVRSNDNTTKAAYNLHDADATIHFQDSLASARPVAGTAGRKWLDNDTYRVYWDDGAAWHELAYAATGGGAFTAPVTITSTTSPQLTILYDGSNTLTIGVSSAGVATFNATGASQSFVFSDPVTNSGTLTQTGVATFAAQPILSSLTASLPVFTDASKGLVSNAMTGTGSVVMSASPTFTGTITAAIVNFSGLITGSAGLSISSGTSALQALTATTGVFTGAVSGITTLATSGVITTTMATPLFVLVNSASASKTWKIGVSGNDFFLQETGVANQFIVSAGGAVAFAGAVSGVTTLATTDKISTAITGIGFESSAATTSARYMHFGSTGGEAWWGIANSTGSVPFTTGANYATVLASVGATPVVIGYNSAVHTTFNAGGAVAFTGALSGITTLAGTGAVSGFTTASFSGTVTSTVTATNNGFDAGPSNIKLDGTGGKLIFGGTADYIFGNSSSHVLQVFTNSTLALTVTATQNLTVAGGSILIGAMSTANGSAGNVYLTNGTAPTGNPTGGIFIWAEAGAGKARGTSGTVTTWAPAEPHCPVCKSDFGHEWANPRYGGQLRICMRCLTDELGDRPWIRWNAP